jgi:hypothetical protein
MARPFVEWNFNLTAMKLVDEKLCRTGVKQEELFQADSAHNKLCFVPVNSELYSRLVKFLKSIAEEGRAHVALSYQLRFEETSTLISGGSINLFEAVNGDLSTPYLIRNVT